MLGAIAVTSVAGILVKLNEDRIKGALAPRLAVAQARKLQASAKRNKERPQVQKYQYETARKSMLGEFSSSETRASQPCVISAKGRRRQERMSLVSVTKNCRKHNNQAVRLRQDMDEVENMRCAEHVYLANQKPTSDLGRVPPPGFKMANDDELAEMGLTEEMLHPKDPKHFKAEVYTKDPEVWGPDPKPRYVLAFRGSTPELSDWQNNFNQDAGKEAPYYRQAVKIGNRLAKGGADVHLVGHSLGGGLASAAQGGSGLSASTYNAAGLHPETVARYSVDKKHMAAETSKIMAIRVKGEVLTRTQESIWGSTGLSVLANNAAGAKRDLTASHSEVHFRKLMSEHKIDAGDDYATYLHGMDEVIDSMEMQKKADEEALVKCRAYRGQCP